MDYNNMSYNNMNYYNNKREQKGLAIASLVLGIIGLLLSCCCGGILGVFGLILGIVSLVKGLDGKEMAAIGIVLSTLAMIVTIFVVVFGAMTYSIGDLMEKIENEKKTSETTDNNTTTEDNGITSETPDEPQVQQHFWGSKYQASDGSTIYFYEDGTYDWYQDEANSTNVKKGRYQVRFGQEAFDYITIDLAEYAITSDELNDYLARQDDEFYSFDNLTELDLWVDQIIIDGEEAENKRPYTHYYGFSNETYFDGANMDSAEYATFYVIE